MIDLHSHILPGIDDGAKELTDSLAMVMQAAEGGTRVLTATPHIQPGVYDNNPGVIAERFALLSQAVAERGIAIELRYGAEVHLCPEIMLWAQKGQLPFIGRYQNRDLLLLELPHASVPLGTMKLIKWLLFNGIVPMIAHPERNHGIWKEPNWLQQFIDAGCLLQVTGGSLLGQFRSASQTLAEQLITSGAEVVLASDAHDLRYRTTDLQPARQRVVELAGESVALRVTEVLPQLIIC